MGRSWLPQMGHPTMPSVPEMGTRARRQVTERKDEQPTLPTMLPTCSKLTGPPTFPGPLQPSPWARGSGHRFAALSMSLCMTFS